MRTLAADLLAAQRAASSEPAVTVGIENSIGGIRRLDFALLDSTANTIAKHDAAVPADGSLTRVRMESGTVKQQRVSNPAVGPWTTWNNLTTGMGSQVACAAKGARVSVIYTDAAGTGIKLKESTDNGATYGSEIAVVTAAAAVVDLAVTYKNTSGDLAIAWATATTLSIIKRTAGTFGSAATTTPGVSSFNGLAMTYGFDWDMLVTGVETTTLKPTLWTMIYGDGNDAASNTWGTVLPQQQAESDASITYKAPSIIYTDTYRMDFLEADTFTGGITRVFRTSLHPAASFVIGAFSVRSPVPVNFGSSEGLALAADVAGTGYVYECAADGVYRAAQSQQLIAAGANVLAIDIAESAHGTTGHIDLDNSAGLFAGPPAPVQLGNLVTVSWGYRTASGLLYSAMPDLWIAAYEHRRTGGVSVLRIFVEGGWETMRRNRQRAQVVHTTDSYVTILIKMLSRAGLQLLGTPSTRASTVVPKFTIAPDTDTHASVRQALAFLADRIRMSSAAAATISEPLASAASDYTFGAAHPLRSVRLRGEASRVAQVETFGAGAYGEATTYADAQAGVGATELQRDQSSSTGAAAAATAAAHLRQRTLDTPAGELVAPPNCGQEILDVVDFTDALVSAAAVKRRVAGIRWRFERVRGIYEQTLLLGAM